MHGQHHSLGTFDEEKLAYESLQRKWPPEKDAKTAREERKNKVRAGNYWGALGEAPKRLWKGVTFEPDRKKWKVQPSGPRFDDQKEAAECYAEKTLARSRASNLTTANRIRFSTMCSKMRTFAIQKKGL